jgi:uracil-DNA glycosylase family 4
VADAELLERLRVTASTCTLCPLSKGRTQVVFGVGSPGADLLFVGEGPGREEDLAGEPFVGRSGKLLDRLMWEEIGLTRAECYIANVVKCRPPQNRDPAPKEIEACRPYLEEQITLIDPTVIVTLGNFATKLLLDSGRGIRELRGQVFERGRARVIPTYHPAYVLRAGGEAMAEMRADFVRAKRLVAAGPAGPADPGQP